MTKATAAFALVDLSPVTTTATMRRSFRLKKRKIIAGHSEPVKKKIEPGGIKPEDTFV